MIMSLTSQSTNSALANAAPILRARGFVRAFEPRKDMFRSPSRGDFPHPRRRAHLDDDGIGDVRLACERREASGEQRRAILAAMRQDDAGACGRR
jgi:hypothetical protein